MDAPLFPQKNTRKTPFPENLEEFSGKSVFWVFSVNSDTSTDMTGALKAEMLKNLTIFD